MQVGGPDGESGLTLQLRAVPKALRMLRSEWAPRAYVVSFKLETDETLIASKAVAALRKYGVHCVVANELTTRRDKARPACALLPSSLSPPQPLSSHLPFHLNSYEGQAD